MIFDTSQAPGFLTLVGRLVRTSIGAVQNRFELLAVEWQEERNRLTELLIWIIAVVFMGVMSAVLLTATIILVCPQEARAYVAGGFTLLYLIGTTTACLVLRRLLRREPFAETIEQGKRDREWLRTFN